VDLEKSIKPDLVFVISGDEFNHSIYSFFKDIFGYNYRSSKWVGIFISCWCYSNSLNWLKINILRILLKKKLKNFDAQFWLDEYFAGTTNIKNSFWLPDISKSFNLKCDYIDDESDLLCSYIDDFLLNNKGKEVLLFFGRDFNRKGFDYLVELALNDHQFIILRAGDSLGNDENRKLVPKMAVLENDARLLNLNYFIKSPKVIDKIFNSTNFIPLPYRDHYSSSGVMLQAMEFNKPVIVPDIGLMGKRVVDNNIGMTYRHKDFTDFKEAVYKMQKSYDMYINNISNFYSQFSKENIFSHLDLMFNGED
jgi:glycosyltransferase involved in cell wall biosynthesis